MEQGDLFWKKIQDCYNHQIFRVPILGGWLVKTEDAVSSNGIQSSQSHIFYKEVRTSITFVPDPMHEWDLKTEY